MENNIYCAHIPLNHLNKNSNIPDDTIFNNNTFSCLCNELICASDSTIQWVGQDVFIKIKRGFNIDSILNILNVSYTKINHWNNYCQEECIICVEDENAIDCANRLFESNYFVYAMPSFYRLLKLNSLSYKDQWNLSNTGQLNGISDIDINIEDAWQITKGDTNITISVIDNGIDIYHEDLYANMLPGHGLFPFDSLGLYNDNGNFDDSHGTMCAGIIAAMDNDTGIIGIANKSKIISVKYHPILYYKAVRSGDCEYTVQIAGDTDLLQGEAATFTATGAESYRWYNAGGELLGTAETMTAVPAYSQCYYLETTGGLCGYISRDTVCVHVSEGEIVTLYPNPTNDFVHLEYQITGNYNNASIQITNELGTTQQTVTLNEPQGSATLDVQGLPAGAYYVLLKSPSGRVLDIKTLVKGE